MRTAFESWVRNDGTLYFFFCPFKKASFQPHLIIASYLRSFCAFYHLIKITIKSILGI